MYTHGSTKCFPPILNDNAFVTLINNATRIRIRNSPQGRHSKLSLTCATCSISPDETDDATTRAPSTREYLERERRPTLTRRASYHTIHFCSFRLLSIVIQIYQNTPLVPLCLSTKTTPLVPLCLSSRPPQQG
jgi:hypothetical protein